jgi:hypothetical protein
MKATFFQPFLSLSRSCHVTMRAEDIPPLLAAPQQRDQAPNRDRGSSINFQALPTRSVAKYGPIRPTPTLLRHRTIEGACPYISKRRDGSPPVAVQQAPPPMFEPADHPSTTTNPMRPPTQG